MSAKFIFMKSVESHEVISRFGKFEGEQFEIRLKNKEGKWMAFLNFRDPNATRRVNSYNTNGIPEFYAKPNQYMGTIKLLESGKTWFTLYENSGTKVELDGWISSFQT